MKAFSSDSNIWPLVGKKNQALYPFRQLLPALTSTNSEADPKYKTATMFCFLGVLEEPGTCVALLHASSWALCSIFNDFFTVSCVKKHFLLNQELAWCCMYHAQGLEASLESVASSPCASSMLYKCSVFPHCCPFYLLILTDLLLSFDSLGENEVDLHFVIVHFLLNCIFLCLSWLLYQITVEVAS